MDRAGRLALRERRLNIKETLDLAETIERITGEEMVNNDNDNGVIYSEDNQDT